MHALRWLTLAALLFATAAARAQAPPALTDDERAWLRTAPPVIVGVQSDYAPFSFVDGDGRAAGYSIELFALAAKKVGLRYRFARPEAWTSLLPRAQRGEVDVLTCLWRLPERERFLGYVEPPYMRHAVGWAVRVDDPSPPSTLRTRGKVIAIVRDFAVNPSLRAKFPQAMFVETDSAASALRLVSVGKADAYVDNIGLVNYIDAQNGYANVRVRDTFDLPAADYYMAVRRDRVRLRAILGKGLRAVTETERRALEDRWLHERVPLWQALQPYLPRVLVASLGLALLLIALAFWNRRLRREIRLRLEFEAAAAANAETLAQRERFLTQLLDAAQAAILVADGQGHWIMFNRFAAQLLGWDAAHFVGRRVPAIDGLARHGDAPSIVPPDEAARALATLRARDGDDVPTDNRALYDYARLGLPPQRMDLLHRDGHRVPVLLSLADVDAADGTPAGLILVANDLADEARLEAELRASEARARDANDAKSAFLATMSHELRTPLIGVTGMVEVLAHGTLDAGQRQAVQIIQASSQQLLQIIGDILDVSKIEADRLELAPRAIDLPRLLRLVVANQSGAASSKGLALACAIDPRIAPAYRADPLRLRQIVGNLVSNAVKFTELGRVDIALEWIEQVGDADALCIRVTDTGIGVSDTQRARLFEPFVQAESDTTRRYGGTGLGLAISTRLAALMDGRIDMDSAPGRGTTMRLWLTLPRAQVSEVEPDADVARSGEPAFVPRRAPGVEQAVRAHRLILLVDDHPTNRLVVSRQLALAGYACETADDGLQALERWRTGRYALVLSDVHMPGMDGYALARAIRAEEATRGVARTPIVALTAAALKDEIGRCLAAGMDDYLAKPVGVATLAATLQRWLPDGAMPQLPVMSDAAPVDTALLSTLAPNPDDARALLRDFLDSTADDLAMVQAAQADADLAALARQAHRIKGAARLVGAQPLADAADALEADAFAQQWTLLPMRIADLASAALRLRAWVDARD